MSKQPAVAVPLDAAARYLAEKGQAWVAHHQAIVDRAREMLASGEVVSTPDGIEFHRPPPYWWELTERDLSAPERVWLGTVDDFATGEGLRVYFVARFARSEEEFRRGLALELGRQLANRAEVREGVGPHPASTIFLSPAMRKSLDAFDRGEERPGALSFIARYHANYS